MKIEGIPWPFTRFYNRVICKYMENFYNQIAEEIGQNNVCGVILDIGTGPGRLPIKIARLVPTVTIVGMDVSRDMIKIARKNAEQAGVNDRAKFVVGSTYWTGLRDSSFDLIVSTGLVHHLKNPAQAFNELYRILKPQREAWMYDGRRDASKKEIRTIIGNLKESGLALPSWVVEHAWPYLHVGYKTKEYTHGRVAEVLKESLFEDYKVVINGTFLKIILKKG